MIGNLVRAAAVVALLSGCQAHDPLVAVGKWRPSGANDANIAAMVADRQDLRRGVAAEGTDGELAAAAVARLRHDRVKPLPDSGIAKITVTGAAGAAPSGDGAP